MPQVTVHVNQVSVAASEGVARSHSVAIDRPESKGGSDTGAMGGELLLLSLGGCFNSNLLAAISSREAAVSDVKIAITGTLESAPSRFSAIDMVVSAETADKAQLEKLVQISERACIVANTLSNSVDLTVRVA